jgi:hypothetical protein
VPSLFSSAIILIVTAGTRNKNTQGEITNKGSKLEYPFSAMLYDPGIIHKKRLFANRKTITTK